MSQNEPGDEWREEWKTTENKRTHAYEEAMTKPIPLYTVYTINFQSKES